MLNEYFARTHDCEDYKFSTAEDPLFNSTRICKLEDPLQGHRCYRVRTDRNFSMLEEILKSSTEGLSWIIPVEKSNVHERY